MEFARQLENIEKTDGMLTDRIAELTTKIARLTAEGTSSGKEYWMKSKPNSKGEVKETLYILYPMKNGKRRKEYIGRNPVNIKKAQDRLARYAKRKELTRTMLKLERDQSEIREKVQEALNLTKSHNLFSLLD